MQDEMTTQEWLQTQDQETRDFIADLEAREEAEKRGDTEAAKELDNKVQEHLASLPDDPEPIQPTKAKKAKWSKALAKILEEMQEYDEALEEEIGTVEDLIMELGE